MDEIDELNEKFIKNGVEKTDLMKCSILIDSYLDLMIKKYKMEINSDTREYMSECLYLTLLKHINEMSADNGNQNFNISNQFYNIMDDFKSKETDKAIGNMMILIGKSVTYEKTRNENLTRLASRISQNLDDDFNI